MTLRGNLDIDLLASFKRQEETEELEKLYTDNNLSLGNQRYWSCEAIMLLWQIGCHFGKSCKKREEDWVMKKRIS